MSGKLHERKHFRYSIYGLCETLCFSLDFYLYRNFLVLLLLILLSLMSDMLQDFEVVTTPRSYSVYMYVHV